MQLTPELSQDPMLINDLRRRGQAALEIKRTFGSNMHQGEETNIANTFPSNARYHLSRSVRVKLSKQGANYFTGNQEEVYISGQLFDLASQGVFAPDSGYISGSHDAIVFTEQQQGIVDQNRTIEVTRRDQLGQEYKQKLPLIQALHVFNYGRPSGSYMDNELPYRMGTNFIVL